MKNILKIKKHAYFFGIKNALVSPTQGRHTSAQLMYFHHVVFKLFIDNYF